MVRLVVQHDTLMFKKSYYTKYYQVACSLIYSMTQTCECEMVNTGRSSRTCDIFAARDKELCCRLRDAAEMALLGKNQLVKLCLDVRENEGK